MARHAARFSTTPDKAGSSPGSGASVSQDMESITTEALVVKLAKAKEVESALEATVAEQKAAGTRGGGNKGLDEKQQALRLQLCEVLSDVILNDSSLADSSDAIGRLWKTCFYGRINDIRQRISREKARVKKRQAGRGGGTEESVKKMVCDLERQLKQFLKEAIALYKYIIERYVKELMSLSQSQLSGNSYLSQQRVEEQRQRAFVIIASLYRMHIHLGDLHRYSNSPTLAEGCYLSSARLAPGTGNPYNQLAVVAQQSRDSPTAVALYYYARSLMASRSPFETSRSNLGRLFEGNRRWLEEHARDDDDCSRGIVNVGDRRGKKDKAQRELIGKEKTALNRKALARIVDLQWDFFRGVSLNGDDSNNDGKVDLDHLKRKMSSIVETFANLFSTGSFGEPLLLKLVSTLAFSTLGAGNEGRFMNADGFYAKRKRDPTWSCEGIIMANQALAFSFFLRFCAALAMDVDHIVLKRAADTRKGGKMGKITSMSPLLLGFRFVTSIYEGCEWFHGLPFFPSDDRVQKKLEYSSIHILCGESHTEFWKSISVIADHFDKLPNRKNMPHKKKECSNAKHEGIRDVGGFAELKGYVPFDSFLDADVDSTLPSQKNKMKYASVEEVVATLSEAKYSSGGGGKGGVEAETGQKIDLFLLIADGKTLPEFRDCAGNAKCDCFFLRKNVDKNERDIVTVGDTEDDDGVAERENEGEAPLHVPSLGIGMEEEDITDATTGAVTAMDGNDVTFPLKMKGVALLTPAALVGGNTGTYVDDKPQPMNVSEANNEWKTKSPPAILPIDSILAACTTELQSNVINTTVATKPVLDALLDPPPPSNEQYEMAKKMQLPPPPGFAMQPALPERLQLPTTSVAPSSTGISSADFLGNPAVRTAEQNIVFGLSNQATTLVEGILPQAGPSHSTLSTGSMFQTMNPFFPQALPPPTSFSNRSSFGVNPPPNLLCNTTQGSGEGGVTLQRQQQSSNKGGLDSTFDFLLNHGNRIRPLDGLLSSGVITLPSIAAVGAPEDDQSESILNFLFESNDAAISGRPLYGDRRYPSQHGMPSTKNPFVT